jgi:hypothetical protein
MGALKQHMIREGFFDERPDDIDDSEYFEIEKVGKELSKKLTKECGYPVKVGYSEAKMHYMSIKCVDATEDLVKTMRGEDDAYDQWEANHSDDIPFPEQDRGTTYE